MRSIGLLAAVGFAAIYAASLAHLNRVGAFPVEEALAILVIVGFGFSFLAWVTTIGVKPEPLAIGSPGAQAAVSLVLTVAIAFYLVAVRSAVDASFRVQCKAVTTSRMRLGSLPGS